MRKKGTKMTNALKILKAAQDLKVTERDIRKLLKLRPEHYAPLKALLPKEDA